MEINFLMYILVMFIAGVSGFGGGLGGINIIKEFALNYWVTDPENSGAALNEILNISSVAQYGGYTQGMTLAAYLGAKTELGIFGAVLGTAAFMLPSVLIAVIILKIGEKFYKSNAFKYSLNYINLLAAGLICMIVWNYAMTVISNDLIYLLISALVCFVHIFFRVPAAVLILAGGFIGLVWRA